jgi:hypothetical protein
MRGIEKIPGQLIPGFFMSPFTCCIYEVRLASRPAYTLMMKIWKA